MSIFNFRNKDLSKISRGSVVVGTIAVVLALIAAFVGWNLYKKAATTTVVAYFADALAVYPGDHLGA
jgi:phospholipid/cholesterol/gamma-HCH transport system substrate-binding protein